MTKIDCFETDYVYTDTETGDFKNAHISIKVEDECFKLIIGSQDELDKHEVEEVLNQLNLSFFKRLKVSMPKECVIVTDTAGKKKKVEVIDDCIMVKNMIDMEE